MQSVERAEVVKRHMHVAVFSLVRRAEAIGIEDSEPSHRPGRDTERVGELYLCCEVADERSDVSNQRRNRRDRQSHF